MAWGTINVGGLTFRETISASEASDKLTITGQEAAPPQTPTAVRATHLNVLGLPGAVVPVTFQDKTELTGYYFVASSQSDVVNHANGMVMSSSWQLDLQRLGTERDLEFESRISTVPHSTTLSGPAAVFWHAPPAGFRDYYTGATVPSGAVTRQSADGAVTVFTGVPAGVYPRWTCPAASYMNGSARVVLDGIRRVGLDTAGYSTWEINNGLVRLTGSSTTLPYVLSVWSQTASAWVSAKNFRTMTAAAMVTTIPEFTIIRNDPEQVTIRLTYAMNPGRLTVDMSLRRGSRFVTGIVKQHSATTLGLRPETSETGTAVTGGVMHAADANGNATVIGSSVSATVTTGTGALSKASVTSFDFFLGSQIGASPATGDAFADLLNQYLGTTGDQTRTVRR